MRRYRLTGNYGTFTITKVVAALDEDAAYRQTGIMFDLQELGWEIVDEVDGEEWEIEEL